MESTENEKAGWEERFAPLAENIRGMSLQICNEFCRGSNHSKEADDEVAKVKDFIRSERDAVWREALGAIGTDPERTLGQKYTVYVRNAIKSAALRDGVVL